MSDEKDSLVPAWDGRPETFERYREDSLMYLEGTKYADRYLCAPRMIRKLRGAARTACMRQPAGSYSSADGVRRLLDMLEKQLGKPDIPNVGGHLEEYFYKIRRRRGESMAGWCFRSRDVYRKCQQALARVIPRVAAPAPAPAAAHPWTPAEAPEGDDEESVRE